jgi:hypothetical protein
VCLCLFQGDKQAPLWQRPPKAAIAEPGETPPSASASVVRHLSSRHLASAQAPQQDASQRGGDGRSAGNKISAHHTGNDTGKKKNGVRQKGRGLRLCRKIENHTVGFFPDTELYNVKTIMMGPSQKNKTARACPPLLAVARENLLFNF